MNPRLSERVIARARLLLAAVLIGTLAACGGGGGSSPPPTPAPPPVAPAVTTAPLDARVHDGGTATFSVVVTGTAPLSYQWQVNGTDIANATQASYQTAALKLADSGNKYQVVVTGAGGKVTSSAASLTVTPIALSISQQPANISLRDGEVATLSVQATGSEPITYQWYRNGTSIPGATTAAYATPVLNMADDQAVYTVELSNPAGALRSEAASLRVSPAAPSFLTEPQGLIAADGASVTFRSEAKGTAPLIYQWYRNGQAIAGATGASLSFAADYSNNGDSYKVSVSNQVGTISSAAASLKVDATAASFTSQPQPQTVAVGAASRFSAEVRGTLPLKHQWQRSTDGGRTWKDVPGAGAVALSLSGLNLSDTAHRFRVAVTNPAGTIFSEAAELTVRPNVQVFAGRQGGSGYAEGKGAEARLAYPMGIAADLYGNIYVADASNQLIRKISADGQTSRFAGQPFTPFSNSAKDGLGGTATFQSLSALTIDANGNLYVADHCWLRKITPDSTVTTVAGNSTSCDITDGQGTAASVGRPNALATDSAGTVYIAASNTIRSMSPQGKVVTIAGSANQSATVDGSGTAARFATVNALLHDGKETLYIGEGYAIRTLNLRTGQVSLFAGDPQQGGNREGQRIGGALFTLIKGMAWGADGNLYVAHGDLVSRIDGNGQVLTMASSCCQNSIVDGQGASASLGNTVGLARLPNGSFVFAERESSTVRTLSPSGKVQTLVGVLPVYGKDNGPRQTATFGRELHVEAMPDGSVVVADTANGQIRRIDAQGQVSLLAGDGICCELVGKDGNGDKAHIHGPTVTTRDSSGNLYVLDSSRVIRKVTPAGVVTTLTSNPSGTTSDVDGPVASARFGGGISAMAVNSAGDIYIGQWNAKLRKLSAAGVVTTLITPNLNWQDVDGPIGKASSAQISALAIDSKDNVYVASHSHVVRKLTPDGQINTVVGRSLSPGYNEEPMPFTRLNRPLCLAVDAKDNLYICDADNDIIRRLGPDGHVVTVMGRQGSRTVQTGVGGSINRPGGLTVLPNGQLLVQTEWAIVSDGGTPEISGVMRPLKKK